MFLDTSRYSRLRTVEGTAAGGRRVKAVALRRLPSVAGTPVVVRDRDRLDVMARNRYGDGTGFWHIADANTELKSCRLVGRAGRTIVVPEK